MAKAVVTFTQYRWVDEDGVVQSGFKGDTVDVSSKQLDDGIAEGSLRKAGAKKPDTEPDAADGHTVDTPADPAP